MWPEIITTINSFVSPPEATAIVINLKYFVRQNVTYLQRFLAFSTILNIMAFLTNKLTVVL